jgi:hypothetical protein
MSLLLLVLAFGLTVSACGGAKSHAGAGTDTRTATTASTETSPVEEPRGHEGVRVYFTRYGRIATAGRSIVRTRAVARATLGQLFAGPNKNERSIGFKSSLPAGVKLESIAGSDGRFTVRLSRPLGHLAEAQIVTTLTQFRTVHNVVVSTPAARSKVLTRADFEDVMPPVLVESPVPFEDVSASFKFFGTSNVWEGASQMRLVLASGRRKGMTITSRIVQAGAPRFTVSSGTGSRGWFDLTVDSSTAPVGPATVLSYEVSGRGTQVDQLEIPIFIVG